MIGVPPIGLHLQHQEYIRQRQLDIEEGRAYSDSDEDSSDSTGESACPNETK